MAGVDRASDEALLRRVASGDSDALADLFRRRQQNVYRFALHLTGSPAVADDVTQDVFVAAIRSARTFDPQRATVSAWLCGIARNFVRRRLSDENGLTSLEAAGLGDGALPVITPDPLGDLTTAEKVEALRKALLTLPLPYREAVVACDLQELSYAEAATALECPVGTVRSRLNRGRALLAAKMQAEMKNADERIPGTRAVGRPEGAGGYLAARVRQPAS